MECYGHVVLLDDSGGGILSMHVERDVRGERKQVNLKGTKGGGGNEDRQKT